VLKFLWVFFFGFFLGGSIDKVLAIVAISLRRWRRCIFFVKTTQDSTWKRNKKNKKKKQRNEKQKKKDG
jgi:hypothetical protein